jgi:hypothetical protein
VYKSASAIDAPTQFKVKQHVEIGDNCLALRGSLRAGAEPTNSSRDVKSDGEKFLFCFRLLRDF